MSVGTWTLSFSLGPGTHYWGNGAGFGPATKIVFEAGMWELGPGVLTLGGELAMSYFGQRYYENYKETWTNFMFGARSAYHYGWSIKGLDTYAGIPLGLGLSAYSHGDYPGTGYHGVYPYFGFFCGASYYFSGMIGVNGEIGYNSTYANLGLILRL
ncbi:MAG: hypothetical protein WCO26_26085 [Deltaproteobacteria bacterium]